VRRSAANNSVLGSEPLWYKDAIIYEVHVKSFFDSDGDGIGDFRGLTQKLDYLQNLGVTALWLLPFYPSPFRDDGYDTSDYTRIHPQYGTLADFKKFLREAHTRGMRVITELVLNHTSDQHEWFKKSRKAKPGTPWRDFYVWSDTPEKYKDARIIFTDFETSNWAWDPVAKAYYWHRFYSHQPDLNFDNPEVIKALLKVLDYWFEMGVDGMRLDAIPYLFEREGTNCENLPETYRFLETLRAHVDAHHAEKMLLAEANQWPEDAAAYFKEGKRCHMAFHFPLMPRLFMASWMEDRFPIIDIFDQTPAIPESCQWALFLRNHDELTLEMVSDEERDYMYKVYAKDPTARINLGIRRRLAPLLGNNRRKIELINFLLYSLPGTPVLYYGDEIGMGDNHYLGDRNGVRTPMQWNGDRNAGFSRANPQRLFLPVIIDPDHHYEAVNVENHERNQSSLLWWTRRVIALRRRFKAFGRGTVKFLQGDNPKVLAFTREYEDEKILIVVNLSRFSQVARIDLTEYTGYVPQEVVSGNNFPEIRTNPYVLTLGFYDYYWFALRKEEELYVTKLRAVIPELTTEGPWETLLEGRNREKLERDVLPSYIESCRWFGGKARMIKQLSITEHIPVELQSRTAQLLFLEIRYAEGSNEHYLLPLAFVEAEYAQTLRDTPQAIVTNLTAQGIGGAVCDAVHLEGFRTLLLRLIARRQSIGGTRGELVASKGERLKIRTLQPNPTDQSQVLKAEQSNTSFLYGNEYILKLYRRLEEGLNPDLEVGRFLTEVATFGNTPTFFGALEYQAKGVEPIVLGILQQYVPNEGDAWKFTLECLKTTFDQILARRSELSALPDSHRHLVELSQEPTPPLFEELIGGVYLEMARLLGVRTGEMHLALLADNEDPKFTPESFSVLYQRSIYHSMRTLTRRVFETLNHHLSELNEHVRNEADSVLRMESRIIERMALIYNEKLSVLKTRIHGDFHLGQVLYTGNDFFIIDFEGEPSRSIGERRLKRSPLRDVAGMIRSFHYPGYTVLFSDKTLSATDVEFLRPWVRRWYNHVSAVFLRSYLQTVGDAPIVPKKEEDLRIMLDAYLLNKAVYEIGYELNNRPDWLTIPLEGIKQLMEE
jgi:maltose alpha-D-glucosyltransferase / alpha-amylase